MIDAFAQNVWSAGEPCLDFLNTKSRQADGYPWEIYSDYGQLVRWCFHLGTLGSEEAGRLLEPGNTSEAEQAVILARALEIREAGFTVFSTLLDKGEPEEGALAVINRAFLAPPHQARLKYSKSGFRWEAEQPDLGINRLLWPIVSGMVALLCSDRLWRVRICGTCRFLFLDTSKGGQRRWCDMKTCGNRAKARRHHERIKGTENSI